jgi:polysaccharide biosynthesis/export protein
MNHSSLRRMTRIAISLLAVCGPAGGCATVGPTDIASVPYVPRELDKQPHPEYVIEPPDILQIDAIRLIPKGPYKIEPLDTVLLRVTNTFPDEPIDGAYPVEADGTIDLGLGYGGKFTIVDMTVEEARAAIVKQLANHIKGHKVVMAVSPSKAIQQVRGQHLVRSDGTVGLGVYGSVRIVGMTIEQSKAAIEKHLAKQFIRPEVSVDILAYNSKLFYVIMDGGGNGEQVVRLPITGNETVLDAIAQVNGILPVSDKREIFVARPSPGDSAGDQVLPVDWVGLCTKGRTATNYQLLPGDRVYVNSEHIVQFDTRLARILSPIDRLLGTTLLGSSAYYNFRYDGNANGSNR